jgi:hypothetical protein
MTCDVKSALMERGESKSILAWMGALLHYLSHGIMPMTNANEWWNLAFRIQDMAGKSFDRFRQK